MYCGNLDDCWQYSTAHWWQRWRRRNDWHSQGLTLPEISVEDFERSWRRVELIATANQWNEEKKLAVILALLRGKLLDFYAVLTSEERKDLVTMKKALSDRAGVTKDPLKSAKHFGERRQEAKESVRDFELGLRKLFKEAYPTEDADGSSAYLSRFITGLSPSIAREVLLRGTPDNIEDAVKKALDVERVMHYVKKQETEVMKVDTSEKQRHNTAQEILEQIVKRMEALESKLEKPSYRPQQARRRCYNCNEEGHYRRNCHVERSDSSQMRKKKAQEQFKVCGGTSKTMRVHGFMGDSPVEFLIDSGAAVSVVRYETIPHSMVIANSASSAVGANGDSLDVIGCIELAVILDTLNVKHSFIVVKRLTVECILGIDFLSKYGAVIDCANDMVSVQSFGSRVHVADPTPQIGNAAANVVIVGETARIPSCSSCIVSATVQNGDALSGRVGILEPHDNIPSSLLVARSLNTVSKANVIAIQVTNTGHSETTLYKGTQIGIFSIEHCVMALDTQISQLSNQLSYKS